jgi:hypothetical protein
VELLNVVSTEGSIGYRLIEFIYKTEKRMSANFSSVTATKKKVCGIKREEDINQENQKEIT